MGIDIGDGYIRNARVMTCDPARPGLGIIARGAVIVGAGHIEWVGEDADFPAAKRRAPLGSQPPRTLDLGGRLLTPGLVDCHTHAIFAGDRANEFAMRAAGADYQAIGAAGGGIAATLGPTRGASDAELLALLQARIRAAKAGGTTTIEVKSGYDLTVEGELRLLRIIEQTYAIPTLLAHLIPPERKHDRDAYVGELVDQLIPRVAAEQLATSVDIYCDVGAFTLAEARRILGKAKACGLAVRGHVGQFEDLGGAELLAELGALSADHLEQVSDAGIAALARAGTVAVMLPGACVQLRMAIPPVAKLRAAGVPMAIASDLNPGTSFCDTLPIQLWLATTHYGMTVEEAWLGVTRHAAKALGVKAGAIIEGRQADMVSWHCRHEAEVPYRYGSTALVDKVYGTTS